MQGVYSGRIGGEMVKQEGITHSVSRICGSFIVRGLHWPGLGRGVVISTVAARGTRFHQLSWINLMNQ